MSIKLDGAISNNNNIFAPKNKTQKDEMKDLFSAQKKSKDQISDKNDISSMSVFKVKSENEIPGQPKLSEKAQKLLEKLKNEYGDKMDFMVFGKDQDPKEMLPYATKEYAVLFSAEELEKMAEDEDYEKKNMDQVMKAVGMADEIMDKFKDDPEKAGMIKRIGISFNSDGSVKLFADLEKSTEQQSERLEKIRDKRAEDKKEEKLEAEKEKKTKADEKKKAAKIEAEKNKQELTKTVKSVKKKAEQLRSQTIKRKTVESNSMDDLIDQINNINWEDIEEELILAGIKFNRKA